MGGIYRNVWDDILMKKTTIKLTFKAFGDNLIPENITQALGITPTVSWKIGDEWIKENSLKGIQERRRFFNTWQFTTGVYECDNFACFEKQLVNFFNIFKNNISSLIALKEKRNLIYVVEITSHIEEGNPPNIVLGPWFIDFLHSLSAEIGIDLYVDS
jgi:hypothetical protein